MMILRIISIVFLLAVGFVSAAPRDGDAITYVEKYNSEYHEDFVKNLIVHAALPLQERIDELNAAQIPVVPHVEYEQAPWYAKPIIAFSAWMEGSCNQELYVACEDGEPVGFIRWFFRTSGYGVIAQFAVAAEYRKRGHGAALLQKTLDEATQKSIIKISTKVNAESADIQRLYRRMGFIKEGECNSKVKYVRNLDAVQRHRYVSIHTGECEN